MTKAEFERMRRRIEGFESVIEDARRSTNTKIQESKKVMDNQMENRLADMRRLFEKLMSDSQSNLDEQFRVAIHDRLEDRLRALDQQFDLKVNAALKTEFARYNTQVELHIDNHS